MSRGEGTINALECAPVMGSQVRFQSCEIQSVVFTKVAGVSTVFALRVVFVVDPTLFRFFLDRDKVIFTFPEIVVGGGELFVVEDLLGETLVGDSDVLDNELR